MHPSEHIKGNKGTDLEGKKIILGVTGSIAAVECVKLVRDLVREGAEVHCVMSEWAQKIIHPYSLEFASGNDVITEITGQVEHVSLCGKVPDKADLYLISPATANTVSKIAQGIDDTAVTTFATTSLGSKIPMVIVPAMHESMYDHPIVMENIEKLKDIGITFIGPNIEEGTAKIAGKDEIVDGVIRRLKDDLDGKKVTVITGCTQEPIDSMRVITNRATGRSGIEIAKRAYRRGAEVELWHGGVTTDIPSWIPNREFNSIDDLMEMADDISGTVIVPAAIGDFRPKEKAKEKIPSSEPIELELEPTPKFIDNIREKADYIVAYKATDGREKAVEKAKKMIDEGRADMVVANSLKDVKPEENRVYITSEEDWFLGTKREIADIILDNLPRGNR
ncbi:MAG: bifunctional phosphopantothenoylcysteine decarboxylase/phosphopantothenate--cysteine ligase CoaBC [Thermoplasmatota archaeon]